MTKFMLIAGLAGVLVVACTQETTITGPDCFAKANTNANGGGGGAGSAGGGGGEGAPGSGSASAESGCTGAGVATK